MGENLPPNSGINTLARVLVTGANGFSGTHCLNALRHHPLVFALTGRHQHRVEPSDSPRRFGGDLGHAQLVCEFVRACQPTHVLHLAGLTPARSTAVPAEMLHTNVVGTANLLDALRAEAPAAITVVASSASVYGNTTGGPVTEAWPIIPGSAYAASKAAQELTCSAYGHQFALKIVRARTFNLVGPGEPEGLVCAAIARQIARAEADLGPATLQIGRTDTERDFVDIRDAVAAYLKLAVYGRAGEVYNVCRGQPVPISEILERLIAMARIRIRVLQRDSDIGSTVKSQWGSADKLRTEIGWEPAFSLEQSLRDLLEWWRRKVLE